MSTSSRGLSSLGRYAYALSAVLLGIVALVWKDFATPWQNVGPDVPHRVALACLAGVVELVGGAALLWRPTARLGAIILTCLVVVFTALWVPTIVKSPLTYDGWGTFFEQLSILLAGAVLVSVLVPAERRNRRREVVLSRLYGVCPISFGVVHFLYLKGAAGWVPAWLPPNQVFWVFITGVCFELAAIAILLRKAEVLAARLLTVAIGGFQLLIWLPKLFAAPTDHFAWAGNGINAAMLAAAWAIADGLSALRESETAATPAPVTATV